MTEERESDKKVIGGPGITADGNVTIGDVSGSVVIGKNIIQLSTSDKKELMDSLIEFQREIAKLGLPADELSTVNGDVTAAIKEAKKEEPDPSKIKSRFEGAIETIKGVGKVIEKVSESETTKRILKILGIGLSILL
jgi:hypothetical protein